MPIAECKYYTFEKRFGPINCDTIIAGTATCLTMSAIIAYLVYLGYNHS